MTNLEWGKRVGCTHSTASRLRRGDRLPSMEMMTKIGKAFGIPDDVMMRAHRRGPESFGRLIRKYERSAAVAA